MTVAVISILILWGLLYLIFRDWRMRFQERAAFGKTHVATAIDPLAKIVPSNVDPTEWRLAVRATHEMIVTLTGSNVLTFEEMKNLRGELAGRTARVRPETARAELRSIWKDLEHRAGPIIKRHLLPEVLKDPAPSHQESKGLSKQG